MLGLNSIYITPDILMRISDVDEFKGYWTALEKHTTGLYLIGDFAKHGQGFGQVVEQLKSHPISMQSIQKLYAVMIARGGTPDFKTEDNQVVVIAEGDVPAGSLDTAPPEQVGPLLEKLLEWVNGALDVEQRDLHPLIVVAVFYAIFLQIAPFEKGNQRLANIWVQILLAKAGYSYAPYASLESVVKENAGAFFKALKHNQDSLESGRPDWSQWIQTFLMLLQDHKDLLQKKLKSEGMDLSHLPDLSAKIMALFDTHKRLQMKDIMRLTNGRRATIKLRLSEMLAAGYLKRHGGGRSVFYSLV